MVRPTQHEVWHQLYMETLPVGYDKNLLAKGTAKDKQQGKKHKTYNVSITTDNRPQVVINWNYPSSIGC